MVVEDTIPRQTSEQWGDLTQLLDKFQTIFSQNKNSQQESKEIQTQIEELLKAGFIRPSHSPYAAPVTLAYKKDEDTLDLTSGYWHIKIHEKDAEKLAFTTNLDSMNG
ncbi:hypothetical protein TNCV_117801 [Trichonephila clavipes]|nr:hypothetical protein TNCV_117801 [Trichonephila clavipes]